MAPKIKQSAAIKGRARPSVGVTLTNNIVNRRYKNGIHYLLVVALLSLFFTTISNAALWRYLYQIVSASPDLSRWFLVTTPVGIFLLLYAIFLLLFSWKYVLKPAFVILLLTCASATYAAWSYGIIFDSGMITNIVETNVAEASSYFSVTSVLCFVLLGVVPSLILLKIKVYYPRFWHSQLLRLGAFVGALVLAVAVIAPFYQQYVFLGRNNSTLQKEILPVSYINYSYKHVYEKYFKEPLPYVSLGDDAQIASTTTKPKLMFLVIGETARAHNYAANGYERPTNQYTASQQTLFYDIASCGTYTSYSLPCMFSNLTREHYKPSLAENRDGIIQVLTKAGIKVTWVENDSGCKGVCKGVTTISIDAAKDDPQYCNGSTCWDEVLLKYAEQLSAQASTDTLIVFHIIGSHGPRYYERYPKEFRRYVPDCNRPDVENCTREEVVNAYDNTILYTDYVISKLIALLEQRQESNAVSLLYVSDHGESLGENNVYLHAAPYALAPEEQIRVPLQLWLPQATAAGIQVNTACLQGLTARKDFSHDYLFHTLMGMMQVKSAEYRPQLDLIAQCPLP